VRTPGRDSHNTAMLIQSDIDRYHRDGFIVVPGVLDAGTLDGLRAEIDSLVEASRSIASHTSLYDLEDGHSQATPRVRRLKDPDKVSEKFAALVENPKVLDVLDCLWGGRGVRFDKSKLNMKSPGFGSPVEWHQDWAFYPHTNDDLAAVGFMLDDVTNENGPMMVVRGSHRGPVLNHHANDVFCGAVDIVKEKVDLSAAVPLTGQAGSITVHHVRALHGSEPNRSGDPRRFLLHQYCAPDAWPLLDNDDYAGFTRGLVRGNEVKEPRLTNVPVRLPLPRALNQGSIYENQRELENTYFD